jgi:hypothetical protein
MQGIYINGRRPKSKKEVKEAIGRAIDYANQPTSAPMTVGAILEAKTTRTKPPVVRLEATFLFGNEYDGPVSEAPDGTYTFVGPDPYTSRKFYGTITKSNGKVTVK